MSSYFCLGIALVSGLAGIVYSLPHFHVVSAVFIVGSVIIARCDTIITLLRSKQ